MLKTTQEILNNVLVGPDGEESLTAIETIQEAFNLVHDPDQAGLRVKILSGPVLDRLAFLESIYVVAKWFETVSSQSGGITPPAQATVVLDAWPEGVDAIPCGLDSYGKPDREAIKSSGGVEITASLTLASGTGDYTDYTLSATPSGGFPCALLYAYRVPLKYLDWSKVLVDEGISFSSGSGASIPDGSATGDIVRWNDASESWEVKSEPLEFQGLVLTPALASLIEAEGAIYYNASAKGIMVCTDV